MSYRLKRIIAPDCVTYGKPKESFEEAYNEYLFEDTWTSSATVYLQERRDGGWATLSGSEIARRCRKVCEMAEVSITTKAYTYTFKLPKKIEIPSDLDGIQRFAYAILSLMCDGMTAEPREGL